jgi:hypothetical protein
MTTLVVHEMLTALSTFEVAQRNVVNALGFTSGTNLVQDFVLTNNTTMHTMAQRLAFAFGEATQQALKDANINPQEAFLAAVQYVRNNTSVVAGSDYHLIRQDIAQAQEEIKKALANGGRATVLDTLTGALIVNRIQNGGVFIPGVGFEIDEITDASAGPAWVELVVQSNKFRANNWLLSEGEWGLVQPKLNDDTFVLNAAGVWKKESDCDAPDDATLELSDAAINIIDCHGRSFSMMFREVVADGRTLKDLWIPHTKNVSAMPSGSRIFWVNQAANKD